MNKDIKYALITLPILLIISTLSLLIIDTKFAILFLYILIFFALVALIYYLISQITKKCLIKTVYIYTVIAITFLAFVFMTYLSISIIFASLNAQPLPQFTENLLRLLGINIIWI